MSTDEFYMQRCLELAEMGKGAVAPNPMVGSVIVCDGKVIGEGHHQAYGGPHAEVHAIQSVKEPELLLRSTLYVNLEPCAHYGKTPPCSDLIVRTGIPEVVIGCVDSNSLVAGKGIEKMEKAGIKVRTGVLESQCRLLNRRFYTFHEQERPYIILKWAQSKDGFIDRKRSFPVTEPAAKISGKESDVLVHQWRSEEQAILVGTNTALMDDPSLTVRWVKGKNPLRMSIDRSNTFPDSLKLFNQEADTLIFTSAEHERRNRTEFVKIDFSQTVIPQILKVAQERKILSILVEGGSETLRRFLETGLWDEARIICSSDLLEDGVKAPEMDLRKAGELKVGKDTIYSIFREPNF